MVARRLGTGLGRCHGKAGRIAWIRTGERDERGPEVVQGAGERPGRVHQVERHPTQLGVERLDVGHAARRWAQADRRRRSLRDANRPAVVGAEAERGHPGRHRRRVPTGRAAGREARVAGISSGAVEVVDGVPADLEVGLVALADDERARVEQPLNHRGIAGRAPVGIGADPLRVQHPFDVEVILDRDRNAVERQCRARLVVSVRRLGGRERRVTVDALDDGVHEPVDGVDPVEVRFQHLPPADLARADTADELERAEFVQLRHLGASSFTTAPSRKSRRSVPKFGTC